MKLESRVKKFARVLKAEDNYYNKEMAKLAIGVNGEKMEGVRYREICGAIKSMEFVKGKFFDCKLPWDNERDSL